MYARMRADHGPVVPVELEPGVHGWLVTDYATLISWSRDTTTFSHDPRLWRDLTEGRVGPDSALVPVLAPRTSALYVDGAEHQRYREVITEGLGGVDTEHLRRTTSRYADRLIDGFRARGRAELLGEYARVLPPLVMNDLLGLDGDQGARFATAIHNLRLGADARRSGAEAGRVLAEAVAARRREPGDDLITRMIRHRAALSDEEAVTQLLLVTAAANEPTAHLIDAVLRACLTGPSGPGTVPPSDAALAEILDRVLWRDPPITNFPVLYPRVDVPLDDGRVIGAGTPVLMAFAAANHFFARENAERMEETANRAHVAWGAGPHRCPAIEEATTVAGVAVRVLLTRLPGLRLAVPPDQLRWRLSALSWSPVRLPVEFAPQEPPPRGTEEAAPIPADPPGPGRRASGLSSLPDLLARLLRRS
ncbi:cytochrome P450 [Nocardiopsis dassonvillei]|uniref:cytochrome P450 n=1 Tax=Nocardiopsis dassonvillei TaxID=2014 RepID=UPI0020A339BD|nr:cytochrome P450 [Nocardiopsis dassonvillei]MCP3014805.1 cytochrome P450 [Nocardiopsis dassonvillei]